MDILIKGIEIPNNGTVTLVLHPNKDVYLGTAVKDIKIGTAIELPPHGDLIDRDHIKEWLKPVSSVEYSLFVPKLDMIPVVLEANT